MSHYDKKFENESQDARRNDRHDEVHPDDKLVRNKDKTTVKAEHKDKPKDPE
jgi:hypothetical protein